MSEYNSIVVLGPTASGKTKLAVELAARFNGEIISADSRQVYRRLDIGTGKDLAEYTFKDQKINYHLIDVIEPGDQFYLHDFIKMLQDSFDDIRMRNKVPVICGGTGLYLDALRKSFSFTQIKENPALRKELEKLSKEELIARVRSLPDDLTRIIDITSTKRMIRGIEISESRKTETLVEKPGELPYKPFYIGISCRIWERKKLITDRMAKRMEEGLVEEVEGLLRDGISHERLENLGLEYKFISRYLQGKITKELLWTQLQTAIFQFAKRQMTWFRKMEKEGVKVRWIKKEDDPAEVMNELEAVGFKRI